MTDHNDSLVADYLARVSRATAGLPADRRDELVRDLREHIETSRADLSAEPGAETEAQVRGILERLGDPAVIAQAAAEDAGLPTGWREPPGTVDGHTAGVRSKRRLWLIVAIVGVIVLLALCVAGLFFANNGQNNPVTTPPAESASPVPVQSGP